MKAKTNLLIDFGIFTAMLVALEPNLTGIPVHEWLSVALAVTIVVHLLLHWDWIANVLLRYFKKLWSVSRLQFILDTLLFIAFNAVMLSGLMISRTVMPALGLAVISNPAMRLLHSTSANATLVLVGIHFALNWGWVVTTVRRVIVNPLRGLFKRPAPAPVAVEANHH